MIKKLKSLLFTLSASFALLIPAVAAPVMVRAAVTDPNIKGGLCSGADLNFTSDPSATCESTSSAEGDVNNIVRLVINIFSVVVGIIAVIMIIIGGIKYITSGGDSNNVSSAKNTILYAIIGLVVVALAQILVRYVLSRVNTSTQ